MSCRYLFSFLSSLLLTVVGASDRNVGCYVPGECTHAVSVGFVSAETIADCYDYCAETTGCNYFSHFGDDGICFAYLDCPSFGTEGCSDCISGWLHTYFTSKKQCCQRLKVKNPENALGYSHLAQKLLKKSKIPDIRDKSQLLATLSNGVHHGIAHVTVILRNPAEFKNP